jgi:hypothetical protein
MWLKNTREVRAENTRPENVRESAGAGSLPAHMGHSAECSSYRSFRLSFDGAMRKYSVINAASDDAPSSRGFQCVGLFIPIQRDDR